MQMFFIFFTDSIYLRGNIHIKYIWQVFMPDTSARHLSLFFITSCKTQYWRICGLSICNEQYNVTLIIGSQRTFLYAS